MLLTLRIPHGQRNTARLFGFPLVFLFFLVVSALIVVLEAILDRHNAVQETEFPVDRFHGNGVSVF